jgi:hypothetical protein
MEAQRRRGRANGYARPPARALMLPCTPRSGGIRPGACAIRPGHLRRGLGNRHGSPAGSMRGSARSERHTAHISKVQA